MRRFVRQTGRHRPGTVIKIVIIAGRVTGASHQDPGVTLPMVITDLSSPGKELNSQYLDNYGNYQGPVLCCAGPTRTTRSQTLPSLIEMAENTKNGPNFK